MQAHVLGTRGRGGVSGRRLTLGAVAAGLMLAVVACGGSGTALSGTSGLPTTGGAPHSPVARNQVVVQMTDFHLVLSQPIFSPGTYTFVAVNAGQTVHAIVIAGPGVAGKRTPGVVEPGQSATLTVTLQPGSYEMYCPVDGHKGDGMDLSFTVGGAAETSGSPPGPSRTSGG